MNRTIVVLKNKLTDCKDELKLLEWRQKQAKENLDKATLIYNEMDDLIISIENTLDKLGE